MFQLSKILYVLLLFPFCLIFALQRYNFYGQASGTQITNEKKSSVRTVSNDSYVLCTPPPLRLGFANVSKRPPE
jgi:hypothetical protein